MSIVSIHKHLYSSLVPNIKSVPFSWRPRTGPAWSDILVLRLTLGGDVVSATLWLGLALSVNSSAVLSSFLQPALIKMFSLSNRLL